MSWFRRLTNSVLPSRLSRDIDREMRFHIAELVDELVEQGMDARAARREARRRFGHHGVLKERARHMHLLGWLDSTIGDIRHAARALLANPGFTLVAVSSLALGIGANTAIFSLINAVMLRSLPVDRPEELVRVTMNERQTTFTNPIWEQIRDRPAAWESSLRGTLAFGRTDFILTTGGVMRRAGGAWVSGSYFDVLGVPALLGRAIGNTDDYRGCVGVAMLSHRFWQREYGGDESVVGRTISLNGHPFEIVGVATPGFSGIHVGERADLFAPLCTVDLVRQDRGILDARSTWFINVFARLRRGATIDQAANTLAAGARIVFAETVPTHWSADEQQQYRERTLGATPGANGLSSVRNQYTQALYVLFAVVGVVLLIACANVAQLLLARSAARQHEISVRLALGAGRVRLVRQLLTESVFLALLGAAVGIVFARWSTSGIVALISRGGRAVSLDLTLDLRVLAFTIVTATVTGVLFAVAPAWRATRVVPQAALRGSGRGVIGTGTHGFAKTIVTVQVALSFVLVAGAGLLVGSFSRLTTVDLGFRQDDVLVVSTDWANVGVAADQNATYARSLLQTVRDVPGVRQASASLLLPIGGSSWNDHVVVDGHAPATPSDALVWFNAVSEGYLETLGTSLLAGRDLAPTDRAGASDVVLINQTLARRFFGEVNPLGKQMRIDDHDTPGPPMEIVGVMEDARYRDVGEDGLPTAYVPLSQRELWGPTIKLAVRTDGPPRHFVPAVTAAMDAVNPAISLEFTTLKEQVDASLTRPLLLAMLSGFFGTLALMLAVIGLYGTISYNVTSRRNEIGIRIALGAARSGMMGMVVGEVSRIIGVGIVVGTVLTLGATRLVSAFLFGVTPSDPTTLALSAAVLSAVALAAGLIPAWRASSVNPMVTLRED